MTNLTDYRAEHIADEAARRLEQPELKPCPFCGGEATLHPFFSGRYMAVCKKCSVNMPMRDTYEEAVAAWNTRAERTCRAEYRTGGNEFGAFYCSLCDNYMDKNDRYCPSCGANVIDKVVEQ